MRYFVDSSARLSQAAPGSPKPRGGIKHATAVPGCAAINQGEEFLTGAAIRQRKKWPSLGDPPVWRGGALLAMRSREEVAGAGKEERGGRASAGTRRKCENTDVEENLREKRRHET